MNAQQTESVNTHELREGDVVLTHGAMFRLVDRKEHGLTEYSSEEDRRIHAINGACINFRTELLNDGGDIPRSWLADGWTIQGNRGATWCRVVRETAAA